MKRLATSSVCFSLLIACGSSSESPAPGSGGKGSGGAAGSTTAEAGSGGISGEASAGKPSSGGGGKAGSASGGAAAGVAGNEPGAGKGGAAAMGGTGALEAWPGPSEVEALPATGLVDGNVSGLTYQPVDGAKPAVLWATANIPGNLYRLLPTANGFASDSNDGWSNGKLLHFPSGQGAADAEGVTLGATPAAGLYVASEHDNSAGSTSRLSILRYDVTGAAATLTAQQEWNVTSALPQVGANLGIEAITFIPDADLTAKGFVDESTQAAYDPASYPVHGGGVFFVGVEGTGKIHGLVLADDGSFQLVATIASPFAGVMSLEYDRDVGYLWFGCDATCDNQTGILDIAESGSFTVFRRFERPGQLPNSDNEGIAIAPESECDGGFKNFFWTDDANLDGFAIRRAKVPCGPFL